MERAKKWRVPTWPFQGGHRKRIKVPMAQPRGRSPLLGLPEAKSKKRLDIPGPNFNNVLRIQNAQEPSRRVSVKRERPNIGVQARNVAKGQSAISIIFGTPACSLASN
eukprot:1160695-Pelagomonas_calceolata.AAC.6